MLSHSPFCDTLLSAFRVKASGQNFPANNIFHFPLQAKLLDAFLVVPWMITNEWTKGQRPSQQQIAGNKHIGYLDSACHVTVLFWSDWRSIPPFVTRGQTFCVQGMP